MTPEQIEKVKAGKNPFEQAKPVVGTTELIEPRPEKRGPGRPRKHPKE